MEHEAVFKYIYDRNIWGQTDDYKTDDTPNSGKGSSVQTNVPYIMFLRKFLQERNIKSVADVGCGDWRCSAEIYKGLDCFYIGYDIYEPLIHKHTETYKNPNWRFKTLNCCSSPDKIFPSDLLILKDVLQHWTDRQVKEFMDYVTTSNRFKYILITNCCSPKMFTTLIFAGGWRTLQNDHHLLKPYDLKPVLSYGTKSCLLWEAPPTEEEKDLDIEDVIGTTNKDWTLEWLRRNH